MRYRAFLLLLAVAQPLVAEPVRLATTAFGTSAEVEVRGLPRAEANAVAREALEEIFRIDRLIDEATRAGGEGMKAAEPQKLTGAVSELLLRGLQVCLWSSGAHGPLGGELYRLWNAPGGMPEPSDLRDAVVSADCSRMSFDREGDALIAEVQQGSRIDTSWMMRGFAVDRAAERLIERGVRDAWLEIGPVFRALGSGPDGPGWMVSLPAPDSLEPVDHIWLQDQSLAIAVLATSGPAPGHRDTGRFIDQRTGVPARGVVTVAAVTANALDAEALAATLFILGRRDGQMRLSSFNPRPSVLWLLGDGGGMPLQSTYNWAGLRRNP